MINKHWMTNAGYRLCRAVSLATFKGSPHSLPVKSPCSKFEAVRNCTRHSNRVSSLTVTGNFA